MSRIEEKILKIIGEYYGDECDIDDLFYENICTSDMQMWELFVILEDKFELPLMPFPEPQCFEYVKNFIDWVVNNLEK